MEEKELKELLLERLHIELQLFRDSMLRKTKEDIYEASYKIEVFVNLYEILLEDVGNMDAETMRGLICWEHGILEALYQEWLTRDDGSYDELRAYAVDEVRGIAQSEKRKELEDGSEHDQVA